MSTQLSNQHSVEEVKTLVSSVVADYLAHASFAKALLAVRVLPHLPGAPSTNSRSSA
jgi:hypothetical protein